MDKPFVLAQTLTSELHHNVVPSVYRTLTVLLTKLVSIANAEIQWASNWLSKVNSPILSCLIYFQCPASCAPSAECRVISHSPICSCKFIHLNSVFQCKILHWCLLKVLWERSETHSTSAQCKKSWKLSNVWIPVQRLIVAVLQNAEISEIRLSALVWLAIMVNLQTAARNVSYRRIALTTKPVLGRNAWIR